MALIWLMLLVSGKMLFLANEITGQLYLLSSMKYLFVKWLRELVPTISALRIFPLKLRYCTWVFRYSKHYCLDFGVTALWLIALLILFILYQWPLSYSFFIQTVGILHDKRTCNNECYGKEKQLLWPSCSLVVIKHHTRNTSKNIHIMV